MSIFSLLSSYSVKKVLRKILRFFLVFLSCFGLVVSVIPSTNAFAFAPPFYYIHTSDLRTFLDISKDGDLRFYSRSAGTAQLIYRAPDGDHVEFTVTPSYIGTGDFHFTVSYNGETFVDSVNPSSFTVSYDVVSGQYLTFQISTTSTSGWTPRVYFNLPFLDYAQDISDSYNDGYSAGYDSGYTLGHEEGVASVDTQSYYDDGYSLGYSEGYSAGVTDGTSSSGSSNWSYVPLDTFSISDRSSSGSGFCYDLSKLYTLYSYQDIYNLTGQAYTSGADLINTFSSHTLSADSGIVGFTIPNPYRTFYIRNAAVPEGAKLVVNFQSNTFVNKSFGQSGTYRPVNPDGSSVTGITYSYPSYSISSSPVDSHMTKVRLWSHGTTEYYSDSESDCSLVVSGSSSTFISSPLTSDSGSFDFQVYDEDTGGGLNAPHFYTISIGYLVEDKSSGILDHIFDLLSGGKSTTPSVVDGANSRIEDFNSSADVVNSFEDNMLSDFESDIGSINSSVTNWSFGNDFLACVGWVSNNMQHGYESSGSLQMFFIYPILVGIALIFIGGGIGKKK